MFNLKVQIDVRVRSGKAVKLRTQSKGGKTETGNGWIRRKQQEAGSTQARMISTTTQKHIRYT